MDEFNPIEHNFMTTFLTIIGVLLVVNFLLLRFSCNNETMEAEEAEEE